ncbi:hypothetical protein ACLMJK_002861 [Lecanora helva]
MPAVPWSSDINFASALLLHSCITVILKETLNCLDLLRRLLFYRIRLWRSTKGCRPSEKPSNIEASAVFDAFTSIYSGDDEGEMAELYFTNTGLVLLGISLATSVAMNLFLPAIALNMIVAGTFALTFVASLFVGAHRYTLPFMSLRRAGRFIWSDTPFVNFFSLIYIATVLRGKSTLRLQDYVIFRSIAVFELVFMKAKLASANVSMQVSLMRKLVASERIIFHSVSSLGIMDAECETYQHVDTKPMSHIAQPADADPQGDQGFRHFSAPPRDALQNIPWA